jgi:hypothetical protein
MKIPGIEFKGEPLRPLGEKEAVRIIVTPLGKRVIKRGAVATVIIGAVSTFAINRLNARNGARTHVGIVKDATEGRR